METIKALHGPSSGFVSIENNEMPLCTGAMTDLYDYLYKNHNYLDETGHLTQFIQNSIPLRPMAE